jgi:hypothetical protein
MPLYLDSDPLPGYDHRVSPQCQLEREDQSGELSGTGAGFKGWKAWALKVSCRVRFKDWKDLKTLRELFQARDADGKTPKLYAITDLTANALGVGKVRFADIFQAPPDDRLHVWNISFTLIEERSIPERTDERSATTPEALPTVDTGGQDGWIEKVLGLADKLTSRFLPEQKSE